LRKSVISAPQAKNRPGSPCVYPLRAEKKGKAARPAFRSWFGLLATLLCPKRREYYPPKSLTINFPLTGNFLVDFSPAMWYKDKEPVAAGFDFCPHFLA
jgi:hypothetical protein